MGLLSIFKSPARPTPETTRTPVSAELWRKTPFSAFVTGTEQHTVYARGRLPLLIPSFVVDFVLGCVEFQTLESHLAEHAKLHAWGSLEIEALRSWLPKIMEAGLLISDRKVHAQCVAIRDPANAPVKIGAIGFPTGGDRVPLFTRAFTSFAGNAREYGREVEWLVADSSTRPEQRARFREKSAELSGQFAIPVRYFGEEEKRALAAEIVRRSGCARESIEFALFDPLGMGFTCGANRNALLLHEAGGVLSSVDDDVICELAPVPPVEQRLALFSNADPYDRWVFGDRASALEAVHFEPRDYLAEHERVLGRDLGAFFEGESGAADFDFDRLHDELLRRLETGAARVRTTFMGYVGDPGIPTSCFFFFHKGRNRERLTASESDYRAGFASRSVLTHAPLLSIGDSSVAPGMAIGLDHRELLPPFFPVLHAEDMVFGIAAWKACTGSVSGHLPFAIHHDSGAGKPTLLPSDLGDEKRAAVFEFAQIIRSIMAGYIPADHADSPSRMRTLGRHLLTFAELPTQDFREAFHDVVLRHESHKICVLEDLLRTETDAPDFWREDMQNFLDHSREALQDEDFDIPFELKTNRSPDENRKLMQQLIASYGALLADWPDIVATARDLREKGLIFSTAVGR